MCQRPPSTRLARSCHHEPVGNEHQRSISPKTQLQLRIITFVLLLAGITILIATGFDAPAAVAITLTASLTALHVCNRHTTPPAAPPLV